MPEELALADDVAKAQFFVRCRWAADELDRLQSIVDRLLVTKDGVTIANNMRLFFIHPELGEIWDYRVKLQPSSCTFSGRDDPDETYTYEASECYSTAEAALKARKEAPNRPWESGE
jgi:hypothetical protein